MMIIYGIKGKYVYRELLPLTCPQCHSHDQIEMRVIRRHFHICYVPIFPVSKSGASECLACNYKMSYSMMPKDYKEGLNALKLKVRNPFYLYTGPLLVLAIFCTVMIWHLVTEISNREIKPILQDPRVGDIIAGKAYPGFYLEKVVNVSSDSVIIVYSIHVNKESELTNLERMGDSAYTDPKSYPMTRKQHAESYKYSTFLRAYHSK